MNFLNLAFEEALNAVGVSSPNPAVGAVVVKDGAVVGRGHTQTVGGAHAEVMALRNAGNAADGATLYVTLEPCCHYGRTPPCTDAIIAAGISRVFFAHPDPNPKVRGKSGQVLAAAGILSSLKTPPEEFSSFYEAYDFFVQNGTPFVECKIAETANGCISQSDKKPLKITGECADEWVAKWRRSAEYILVGGGTVRMDNPRLTVRGVVGNSPRPIVFCATAAIPPDLRLFQNTAKKPLVYSRVPRRELESVAEVHLLPAENFAENWQAFISDLAKKGVHRLAVEMGASLAKNLLHFGLWNRLYVIRSPQIFPNGFFWRTGEEPPLRQIKMLGKDSLWTALHAENQ